MNRIAPPRDSICGLQGLPSELMHYIVDFLPRLSCVAALLLTSSAFRQTLMARAAARLYAAKPKRVLVAGAPLHVVHAVYARGEAIAGVDQLPSAAEGGRADVVAWICDTVFKSQCGEWAPAEWVEYDRTPGWRPPPSDQAPQVYTSRGIPWNETWRYLSRTATVAFSRGHLNVFAYLASSCSLARPPSVFLCCRLMMKAAKYDQVHAIALAHRFHVEARDDASHRLPCRCSPLVASSAIWSVSYGVLRWMASAGCTALDTTPRALAKAVSDGDSGRVDVLTTLLQPLPCNLVPQSYVVKACARDRMRALVFVWSRGFAACSVEALTAAASHGNIEIIWWLGGRQVPGVDPQLRPQAGLCSDPDVAAALKPAERQALSHELF